jgi:hypothetical protein
MKKTMSSLVGLLVVRNVKNRQRKTAGETADKNIIALPVIVPFLEGRRGNFPLTLF